MKIDKVIMSCDDSETYLKLWPYVSKVCKLTLGVTPVLFHITNEYSDFYNDKYGIVKKIKKHPELPPGFQSQIYRLYGTKFFPEETCLISDIDMLIFNRDYFIKEIEKYNDDDFICFLSDAYDLNRPDTQNIWALNRIAMCYNLAKGKIFNKLLNLSCDFNEFVEKVYNYNFGYDVPEFHRDEVFLGKKMFRNLNNVNIIRLNRNIEDVENIPRRVEKKDFYNFNNDLLYTKFYVDCHIPNNWMENKKIFDDIINAILVYW